MPAVGRPRRHYRNLYKPKQEYNSKQNGKANNDIESIPNQRMDHADSEDRSRQGSDLNRKDDLFYSYVSNLVKAKIRIGFAKKGADKFYNFQISNRDIEP